MGHYYDQAMLCPTGHANHPDRRVDAALATVVNYGFDLNFKAGYQASISYLRAHGVPPAVIVRLINYDRRRG